MRHGLLRVFLIAGCAMLWSPAARPGQPQSTPEIMAKKTDLTQQPLAAAVLEDFESIAEDGTELDYLAEFQSWFVLPTPEYAQHSKEFRAAVENIVAAGQERDSEAALKSVRRSEQRQ